MDSLNALKRVPEDDPESTQSKRIKLPTENNPQPLHSETLGVSATGKAPGDISVEGPSTPHESNLPNVPEGPSQTEDVAMGDGKGDDAEKATTTRSKKGDVKSGKRKEKEDKKSGRRGRRGTRNDGAAEGEVGSTQNGPKAPRLPKRQCALLIGFCGSGYSGMQMYVHLYL
jgi:hypothetical protein